MRVLFCNITWMEYYKGIIKGIDEPAGGGSFVDETGDAHESFNFSPVILSQREAIEGDGEYCLGFVETKSTNGTRANQLSIEKIDGCQELKNTDEAEDVLVVYCAKYPTTLTDETYVVGWYKHATVFRNYAQATVNNRGFGYIQNYNAIAKKENCVLLPKGARRKSEWKVNRKKKGVAYGFGQSNVWFATDSDNPKLLDEFLKRIMSNIESYRGENWVDTFPKKIKN